MNIASEHKATEKHQFISYEELKKFQEYQKQLDFICNQLFQVIKDKNNCDLLPYTFAQEVAKVSHKLQSKRFRVVILGEFSQGKSTLINALVREDIQPVRAIACSGTITVLKYGAQRRIVCYYKDGRKEEISFEQYQNLATISREAARQYRRDELARSEIEEIVFEHPDLDLCKNGVEIIDSPGLNEHPDRATITQKLLKNADAVIFITDASKALTHGERNLILDLKTQINAGKNNSSFNNLFLVVNKMDLLDSEDDLQDVQELVKEFAYGKNPVISGQNRVHFISAKAAMKAVIKKNQDEYLNQFLEFVQAVEKFLTSERGYIEIKNSAIMLETIVLDCFNMLQQTETNWHEKIKKFELEKQKTIEKIGELTGHAVRIRLELKKETEQLKAQIIKEIEESWNEWIEAKGLLKFNLSTKAKKWISDRDVVWDQHGIVADYTKALINDLSTEIKVYTDKKIAKIIKHKLENLDENICSKLKVIDCGLYACEEYNDFKNHKQDKYFNFDVSQKGWYGDLWRWITCILLVGYSFGSADEIKRQMKERVIQECITQFRKLYSNEILEKIYESISPVLNSRCQLVDKVITPVISSRETLLEQQEIEYRKILGQYEAEKAQISHKRQELEQMQQGIEVILNQSAG